MDDSTETDLVALAVRALAAGRARAFDDVTVALAQRCDSPEGARSVTCAVVESLRLATTGAWERGWQPADVHRMAVRGLGTDEQGVVVDVMSDELGRYAPTTVDPQWWSQLEALEGGAWWPPSQSWLEARRRRGNDWLTLLTTALTVLHLVQTLPGIERLSPLPGSATPTTPTTGGSSWSGPAAGGRGGAGAGPAASRHVDSRVLERVRMLLAKAESTTFEAEAETFTAGAQALMARHSIDVALLSEREPGAGDGAPRGRRIGIETPYDGPKASLLTAVATANSCRMVWTRSLGFGTVVGFESDLESVELLFTSLLVQANTRMLAEGARADHRGRSRTRAFRSSFLTAYAHRIGERLREVRDAETEAAAPAARTRGQELVPLLAARTEKVEATVGAWFPTVRTRSAGSVRDAEGWHVGRAAADRASLDGAAVRAGVGRRRRG
ncbi:DUF2786 domain-containing protein [Knoellia sp. CPCC 206450]|uniref:DUF2786 domain-containing protein n=1 Tax=Knoellia tibetensis TaxID=3404798 RepID=UPI003B429A5B